MKRHPYYPWLNDRRWLTRKDIWIKDWACLTCGLWPTAKVHRRLR